MRLYPYCRLFYCMQMYYKQTHHPNKNRILFGDTSTFDELRGKIPRSGKDTLGDTKEPKGDFVYTKVHLASLTAKQFFLSPPPQKKSTIRGQNIPYITQRKLVGEIDDTQF